MESSSSLELTRELVSRCAQSKALRVSALSLVAAAVLARSLRSRKDLRGKLVLVTGAASGIGRQLALQFARKGCKLALWDINADGLAETEQMARDAAKSDLEIELYPVDLSTKDRVYEAAAAVKARQGCVDVIVNNAGIVSGAELLDTPDRKIELTFAINVLSHFYIVKAFLPDMIARGTGHIVGVSSAAGWFPAPKMTDYCASKFAARGFYEALDAEMRYKKLAGRIHVSVVAPAAVKTPLFQGFEQPFAMEPSYVAGQIIGAVEQPRFFVPLPSVLALGLLSQALLPRSLFNLFLSFSFGAMNNWNPTQANAVFDKAGK